MSSRLVSLLYRFVSLFPQGFRLFLYNLYFRFVPLWILKRVPSSYAGYLQRFQPGRGDVVIDAGAYNGSFTILASRLVGKRGRVIALEPDDRIRRELEKRMRRSGRKNVLCLEYGLWSGRAEIRLAVGDSGSSSIMAVSEEMCDIPCIDLDSLVQELGLERLDFIKMDIEGAEYEALDGAAMTLDTLRPHLAVASYHIREGQTTAAGVESRLRAHGYTAESGYPPHPTTYGTPPAR